MAMEQQRELAKELVKLCGLVRGSIVHTTRKCGRAQCECAKGVGNGEKWRDFDGLEWRSGSLGRRRPPPISPKAAGS